MKENFPNLVKEIDVQVQRAQRIPMQRSTPRYIIIKMPKVKDKERILKAAKEKKLVTYGGVPIKLSVDFSKETLQARRNWQEIFKVMKSRDLHPRLLYPAKLSFRTEGQENQDGGVGRHTAPPHTTRTDRKSNGKEVQHQGNKK